MLRITEIHHRDGTVTAFVAPPRQSAARTAAIGAVLSVLLGIAACGAALLNGCGDLDPCSCKCKDPYVPACPVSGPGTCGCVIPYYKITVQDGGAGG